MLPGAIVKHLDVVEAGCSHVGMGCVRWELMSNLVYATAKA